MGYCTMPLIFDPDRKKQIQKDKARKWKTKKRQKMNLKDRQKKKKAEEDRFDGRFFKDMQESAVLSGGDGRDLSCRGVWGRYRRGEEVKVSCRRSKVSCRAPLMVPREAAHRGPRMICHL